MEHYNLEVLKIQDFIHLAQEKKGQLGRDISRLESKLDSKGESFLRLRLVPSLKGLTLILNFSPKGGTWNQLMRS